MRPESSLIDPAGERWRELRELLLDPAVNREDDLILSGEYVSPMDVALERALDFLKRDIGEVAPGLPRAPILAFLTRREALVPAEGHLLILHEDPITIPAWSVRTVRDALRFLAPIPSQARKDHRRFMATWAEDSQDRLEVLKHAEGVLCGLAGHARIEPRLGRPEYYQEAEDAIRRVRAIYEVYAFEETMSCDVTDGKGAPSIVWTHAALAAVVESVLRAHVGATVDAGKLRRFMRETVGQLEPIKKDFAAEIRLFWDAVNDEDIRATTRGKAAGMVADWIKLHGYGAGFDLARKARLSKSG